MKNYALFVPMRAFDARRSSAMQFGKLGLSGAAHASSAHCRTASFKPRVFESINLGQFGPIDKEAFHCKADEIKSACRLLRK